MRLRCTISPDADDRFMFWAIETGKIDTEGLEFALESLDTDTLNQLASGVGPDVCAISIAWYPQIADRYLLLHHGGSVGRGYGPAVVAPRADTPLDGQRIGVPGLSTTANLVMSLAHDFTPVVLPITPYARVFEALEQGEVAAAVLIHEGRLVFQERGLHLRLDLGVWWQEATGLPLPLGGNAIRADLPADVRARAERVIYRSIRYGLAHREAAMDWLLTLGGALPDRPRLDRYLQMYANLDTLDYGPEGREAIERMLRWRAERQGVTPPVVSWEGEPRGREVFGEF